MEQQILLPIFSKSTMLEAWYRRAIMAHCEINLILSTENGRELTSTLEEVFFLSFYLYFVLNQKACNCY